MFLSVPLVLLSITVVSLALTGFAKIVVADSIIEGARFAALADQESTDGCSRANQLIDATLTNAVRVELVCANRVVDAVRYEFIKAKATVPGLSILLPQVNFQIEARSANEIQ